MRALSLLVPAVLACSDAKPAPAPPAPERTPVITQLAVGTAHTCALHDDGRVWCWGSNEHGQLGIEKLANSMVPLVVPNVRGAAELAASEATTCVRYADHTVDCWGFLGTSSEVTKPARVTEDVAQISDRCFRKRSGGVECLTDQAQLVPIDGVTDAIDLATFSMERGCVIRSDETLQCWANGRVEVVKGFTGVQDIGLTLRSGCALFADGTVKCWVVDPAHSTVAATGARGLVTGGSRICARTDKSVVCWHDNNDRKQDLGIAPTAPLAIGLHACFARGPREVACWGPGAAGQLGNGWSGRRVVPTRVPGVENAVGIGGAQRGAATCVRTRDDRVWCWGSFPSSNQATPQRVAIGNAREIVGNETLRVITHDGELHGVAYTYSAHPSELALTQQADDVVAASDHCYVTTAGRVRCRRTYVATDPEDARFALIPKIEDGVEVASYSEGGTTCARRRSGAVTCFRPGSSVAETIAISDATAIAVADNAACAIRADRTLWCWGSTASPIFSPRPRPVDVPPTRVPIGEVLAMSLSRDGICVVRASGAVACWGANNEGQLGDGTLIPRDRGSDVIGITDAIDVQVGVGFACALHRTGHVSCWGTTERGQVGTYVMSNVDAPTSVIWP